MRECNIVTSAGGDRKVHQHLMVQLNRMFLIHKLTDDVVTSVHTQKDKSFLDINISLNVFTIGHVRYSEAKLLCGEVLSLCLTFKDKGRKFDRTNLSDRLKSFCR